MEVSAYLVTLNFDSLHYLGRQSVDGCTEGAFIYLINFVASKGLEQDETFLNLRFSRA